MAQHEAKLKETGLLEVRKTKSERSGYIHTLVNWSLSSVSAIHATVLVLGRATHQDRVVGMSLDMLLEILRTLEALAAEIALVRLQGNVNTDMRSNMITLHRGGAARVPLACEVKVVGALATNVLLANVFLFIMLGNRHVVSPQGVDIRKAPRR